MDFFSYIKQNNANTNKQAKKEDKKIKKNKRKNDSYNIDHNMSYENNTNFSENNEDNISSNYNTNINQNSYSNRLNNQNININQNNNNYNRINYNHSFPTQIQTLDSQCISQYDKEEEEEEDEKEENENNKENETKENEDKKKCSLDDHKEIDATIYCQECKVYMCIKCEKVHSGLLKNHHSYSLDKNINEIFTGLCTKPNHSMNLDYYCKTHNQLCCAACIAKIRNKGNGVHKNCKVFDISKIKNKKKNALKQNFTYLEELSKKLEPSINELKTIFEKINEAKENLKTKVQKIFTKIRNELNEREDKLFIEIDKKFQELFFNEKFVKESEKLTNLVKISLEKGKIKENEWEDETKLNKLINNCIILENTIKNINEVYDKINIYNINKELEIEFIPKDEVIEQKIEEDIRQFGGLEVKDINHKNIQENIKIVDLELMESSQNENENKKDQNESYQNQYY